MRVMTVEEMNAFCKQLIDDVAEHNDEIVDVYACLAKDQERIADYESKKAELLRDGLSGNWSIKPDEEH